jgi:hypothetical protein
MIIWIERTKKHVFEAERAVSTTVFTAVREFPINEVTLPDQAQ